MSELGNRRAQEGHIFVCCACGKMSTWKYGFTDKNENTEEVDGDLKRVASHGWDESCMMHAQEFKTEWLTIVNGRVTEIKEPEEQRAAKLAIIERRQQEGKT